MHANLPLSSAKTKLQSESYLKAFADFVSQLLKEKVFGMIYLITSTIKTILYRKGLQLILQYPFFVTNQLIKKE